jgi:hypothetical protein
VRADNCPVIVNFGVEKHLSLAVFVGVCLIMMFNQHCNIAQTLIPASINAGNDRTKESSWSDQSALQVQN